MNSHLRYTDEKDKSYGLTGMAISMVVLDGEEYLNGLSIDAPTGEGIELSQEWSYPMSCAAIMCSTAASSART